MQEKACEKALGLQAGQYEIFGLVPLTEEVLKQSSRPLEIAIRLTDSGITFHIIESMKSVLIEDSRGYH